jgi:hypothetical protein
MDVRERVLLRKVMGIVARVENQLKKEFGVGWFRLKQEDEIRLLRLEGWEEKYKVPVEWILRQLVPFWREKYSKYSKKVGLGVTVATLTGKKSEEILQQRIAEEFPDGENIARWKVREQQRQWEIVSDRSNGREDWMEPGKTLKKYRTRMERERQERQTWATKTKKRRYRNNPWIG